MRLPLILTFLDMVYIHCETTELLYVKSSCKMSYQIKDMYAVTITDEGQVCPNRSIILPTQHLQNNLDIYHLYIKPTRDGRDIELDWEYSRCYEEYYILIEVSFHPDWGLNDNQRRCLHVKVVRLSNEMAYGKINRIFFKCLAVKSKNIGTLTIINNKHVHNKICGQTSTLSVATTFDLGCQMNKADIEVDNCLTIKFRELSSHFDFKRSQIKVFWEDICMHVFDASNTTRYSDPMTLTLPVYGNGTHYIEAVLKCNAYDEIKQKRFFKRIVVSNARSCLSYRPTMPSKCNVSDAEPSVLKRKTNPPVKTVNQLYTIVTVISVVLTVVVIVTVVFIHRNRKPCMQRRPARAFSSPVESLALF